MKERNDCIDILKFILASFIILIGSFPHMVYYGFYML